MSERRYYGLDALRGGMMMLGIVLHGAELYLAAPPPQFPFPADRNNSLLFDLLFHFIHSFRMPAFFLLSGFFTALLVEKRGLAGACRNRAARVLAPLAAAALTILPLTMWFAISFALAARYGAQGFVPDLALLEQFGRELAAAGHPTGEPVLAHLWFLYYLLWFYLLIPLCRLLARAGEPGGAIDRLLAAPATLVALGLYAAATLWPYRGGQVLEGFVFLRPHLPSLVYYGSFFVFGFLLHRFPALLGALARRAWWHGALAAVLFPLALYASHLEYASAKGAFGPHLAAVVANGLCTWALVYFFVGCALRWFDRASPWALYASQSSYWVFLVHMPVVAAAGWWLVRYDLPAPVKFLLAAGFTAVVCFATYHYWVQRTWVSVFLNGRRFDLDWPWRTRTDSGPGDPNRTPA